MKRKERREKREDSRVCWPLGRLESLFKQSNNCNCNKVCTFPGLKRKERREKREEKREKRETTRRREKREERREKREERREKREERREKREEITKKAARDPQID